MKVQSVKFLPHQICSLLVLVVVFSLPFMTQAQTFHVLHSFTDGADGGYPAAGLTMDRAGNLYGTASGGGLNDCCGCCGTVYQLKHIGSNWAFEVLHTFGNSPDGAYPEGRVVFGPDGALYGTTLWGGTFYRCIPDGGLLIGCGAVFRLTPPPTICGSLPCTWAESIPYAFQENSDGSFPLGDVTFDSRGNMYGTTSSGGVLTGMCGWHGSADASGCGTVYELSPSQGGWLKTTVYKFQGPGDNYLDGAIPYSGVTLDAAGNLYGTTFQGGLNGYDGFGVVYELLRSGDHWSQRVLHSFTGASDGSSPAGGLIFDQAGNLYGTTTGGGATGGGTAFQLITSDGGWNLIGVHTFAGTNGSEENLTMDQSGNLYGTTYRGGAYGYGSVFELSLLNGVWTYRDLHDFANGADGGESII